MTSDSKSTTGNPSPDYLLEASLYVADRFGIDPKPLTETVIKAVDKTISLLNIHKALESHVQNPNTIGLEEEGENGLSQTLSDNPEIQKLTRFMTWFEGLSLAAYPTVIPFILAEFERLGLENSSLQTTAITLATNAAIAYGVGIKLEVKSPGNLALIESIPVIGKIGPIFRIKEEDPDMAIQTIEMFLTPFLKIYNDTLSGLNHTLKTGIPGGLSPLIPNTPQDNYQIAKNICFPFDGIRSKVAFDF